VALVFASEAQHPCGDCRFCPANAQACHPNVCSICPSLEQAFNVKTNLIMKVNVTTRAENSGEVSFFANVEKIYQGQGSGTVFEILPQETTNPCYTEYYLSRYVMSIPYNSFISSDSTKVPECFYVKINQCSYFKLWTALTPQELALLAKHEQ